MRKVLSLFTLIVLSLLLSGCSKPSRKTVPAMEPTLAPEVLSTPISTDIQVTSPTINQTVTSPLEITGQAQGPWYFEGIFSAEIVDSNGKSLGTAPVRAQGEWMTEEFVPFSARLNFQTPSTPTGKLILSNANPSGLPENSKTVIIPVKFQ